MSKTWIEFGDPKPSETGKTSRWSVVAKEDRAVLGQVRWFGRWRKYAFYPLALTVFEQDCLRVIADFCERETRELRKTWKRKK